MNQSFLRLGGTIGLSLILLGAGCAGQNTTGTTPGEKNSGYETTGASSETKTEGTGGPESLTLQATGTAGGQASFEWTLGEGTPEPERFILVRGPETDPMHDGTHYWFRVFGAKRSVTWLNLPSGKHHVRMCLSKNGEACDTYSNDVEIDVPSGETSKKAVDISVSAEGSVKQ